MNKIKFFALAFAIVTFALSAQTSSAQSNNSTSKKDKELKQANSLNGKKSGALSRAEKLSNFRINLDAEFKALLERGGIQVTNRVMKKGDKVFMEFTEEDIIDGDLKSMDISFSRATKAFTITFISYTQPDESYVIDLAEIMQFPRKDLIG